MSDPYISEDIFYKHLKLIEETPFVAVDTEGTLNHPHSQTWGISTSAQGISEYFAFNHKFENMGKNLPREWLPKLKHVLENHKGALIFHNAKHDLRALRSAGINYTGPFYDTMIMAHMVQENWVSKKLDYLSRKFGGEPKRNEEVMQAIIDGFGWEFIPVDIIRPYGANDAYITEMLFWQLRDLFFEQYEQELWDWESEFTRVLMSMEDQGVLIDQDLSQQEYEKGLKIMEMIKKRLGLNPGSNNDLQKLLLEELGLPVVKKTKKGKPSFDKEAMVIYEDLLARRKDPRASLILEYRGWQKTTGSNYRPYLTLLGPDGRLRPNFKQHGTKTGRLSCETPNLQQIPKISEKPWNGKLKKAFITESGRIPWELDYSQLEFRLGAAYGKVRPLLDIFNDPSRDVFTEMAAQLGMTRDDVKTLNYTIQYGGGDGRVKDVFGYETLGAARAIRENYFRQYPGLRAFTKLAEQRARQNGYVRYWTGRRRHFVNLEKEAHKAGNSVLQGGGFEIVKRAMVKGHKAGLNNDECRLDLQVHDSIRLDIEEGKEHIYLTEWKKVMEEVKGIDVQFRIEAHRWATKDKVNFEELRKVS